MTPLETTLIVFIVGIILPGIVAIISWEKKKFAVFQFSGIVIGMAIGWILCEVGLIAIEKTAQKAAEKAMQKWENEKTLEKTRKE